MRSRPSEGVLGFRRRFPRGAHVEQVHEEVVGQRSGTIGEHPQIRLAGVGCPAPACHQPAPSPQAQSGSAGVPVQAEAARPPWSDPWPRSCGIRRRSARAGRTTPRRSAPGWRRYDRVQNGTVTVRPASAAAFSMAAQPPSTMRSASDTRMLAGLRTVEVGLDRLKGPKHPGQLVGIVDLPAALGGKTNAGTIGSTALVGATERDRRCPRCGHQLGHGETPKPAPCP